MTRGTPGSTRPPVVCVMGHVDHGKDFSSGLHSEEPMSPTGRPEELPSIFGAYMVDINGQKITFLDTPGHEAFTAMRMRGRQCYGYCRSGSSG